MSSMARVGLFLLLLSFPFSAYSDGLGPSPRRPSPQTKKGEIGNGNIRQEQHGSVEYSSPNKHFRGETGSAENKERQNAEPHNCLSVGWTSCFKTAQDLLSPWILIFTGAAAYGAIRAAYAGIKAANANRDSADTLREMERAWIFEKESSIVISEKGELPEGLRGEIRIKNAGKTPAIITGYFLAFYYADELPERPPFDFSKSRTVTTIPVSPGMTYLLSPNQHFSPMSPVERKEVLRRHGTNIFLLGIIWYLDSLKRELKSAFAYQVSRENTFRTKIVRPGWTYYT